jgi:amino acid transporter
VAATEFSQTGRTELRQRLTLRSNAALVFASVGATAGLYSLFSFSLGTSGPSFIWGWVLTGVGVASLCCLWAELAAHYPLAGAFYHWGTAVAGSRVGWWIGWIYLGAQIAVLTAWYFVLPVAVAPLFGVTLSTGGLAAIALGALLIAAIVNAFGIEFLGRVTVIGVAAEIFIVFVLTSLVIAFGAHQPVSVYVHGPGVPGFGNWVYALLGGGIFVSLWVQYTFENAGLVGEETKGGPQVAPKAIFLALAGTLLMGLYFLAGMIIAIPNVKAAMASATPLEDIINGALPHWFSKLYLVLICEVTFLGANAFFTGVSRQMYGMAREGQLPFSRILSKTRNGTPWVSILVVAVLTGLPLIASQQISVLTTGATASIYVAYAFLAIMLLAARFRGWPRQRASFSMGRYAKAINAFAALVASALVLDLFWPRDTTNPTWHGIRVAYWIIGLPVAIGVLYYAFYQHRRLAPQGEAEAETLKIWGAAASQQPAEAARDDGSQSLTTE